MFISTRFLQMAAVALALAGCASTAQPPAAAQSTSLSPSSSAPPAAVQPKAAEHSITQATALAGPAATEARIRAYADELASQRGLDASRVQALLDTARYQEAAVRLMAPPAPAPGASKPMRSWQRYRDRFVEPIRIRGGVRFMEDNAALLAQAEQRYGVPPAIITAIIGVETLYGRDMGSFRVLDALATLAFDYPDPKREDRIAMFRGQLADLVELSLAGALDGAQIRGSFAGAIGLPQFMPGSIKRYAVDGDGNGKIDLMTSTADAIMSVANFLVEHGWRPGLPVFAPVTLPADPAALVEGGITPTRDWAGLQAAGASVKGAGRQAAWQQAPLGVIDLKEEAAGTVQYRTGTPNFFALTHYNRSYFYATSVADLAQAVLREEARQQARAAAAAAAAAKAASEAAAAPQATAGQPVSRTVPQPASKPAAPPLSAPVSEPASEPVNAPASKPVTKPVPQTGSNTPVDR